MTLRPRLLVLGTLALGSALTLAVVVLPSARLAYRAPDVHVALESVAGLIGLLAAFLAVGRFRRSGLAGDLVLAWALTVLASANLLLAGLPAALGDGGTGAMWGALGVRVLGAAGFALAALVVGVRLGNRGRSAWAAGLAGAFVVAVAVTAAALAGDRLPELVPPGVSPEESGRPLIVGHSVVLAAQLLSIGLFGVAAVGFTRAAAAVRDELYVWLGIAASLAALARLNYFLFPSIYSDWVYTGDAFRLAFYVVLLLGAAREIGRYWRSAADAAVLEERRRIARDLHDGLAQELAFIAAQTGRLARSDDAPPVLGQVHTAADRALGEARRAIAALTRPLDEPLDAVLAEVAEEIAVRSGLRVEFTSDLREDVSADAREQLVRVLREAVTNAARHGRASTVRVALAGSGAELRLTVADDGVGFDPGAPADDGFGLTSMRERVAALGGRFRVSSSPGGGTEVEVTVP